MIDYYYAAFGIHRSREDLHMLTQKGNNVMSHEQERQQNETTQTYLMGACHMFLQ